MVARLQERQQSSALPVSREEVSSADDRNPQCAVSDHGATLGTCGGGRTSPALAGLSGESLLGSTVKNPQGKELGTMKDLVISPDDNRVVKFSLISR
jgi:hypothetical protein